jgi:erythromycin esterase-like protein
VACLIFLSHSKKKWFSLLRGGYASAAPGGTPHDTGEKPFLLSFSMSPDAADVLGSGRLGRAIGVIYRPQTERQSHYFRARVSDQFDAVIHLDETRALEPLEPPSGTRRATIR